jgi:site-specific recombinase XerD
MESSVNPPESPSWDSLIPRYREYLESGALSPRTVDLRLYHLNRIRKFVGVKPGEVTPENLTSYFAAHPRWQPNTRAVVKACMSVFYKWTVDNEHLLKNPASKLMKVKVPQGKPKPATDAAMEQALASSSPGTSMVTSARLS